MIVTGVGKLPENSRPALPGRLQAAPARKLPRIQAEGLEAIAALHRRHETAVQERLTSIQPFCPYEAEMLAGFRVIAFVKHVAPG